MRKYGGTVLLLFVACMFIFLSGCVFPSKIQSVQRDWDYVAESSNMAAAESKNVEQVQAAESDGEKTLKKDNVSDGENALEENNVIGEDEAVNEDNISEPEISEVIEEILGKATKELTGNYRVDDSFLLWLAERYGRESLYELQQALQGQTHQMEYWYRITGKSIHVLWVEYCRETGAQESFLEKVYDKECADENQVVMDFTGDINLAEGWSTTRYLDGQNGEIRSCFSPELWEEMQSADILMVNNEFTYSNRGTPLSGKAYTFRADPERVNVIAEIGTDVLSLANNHVYDYGEEALLDTLDTIEQAGIPYVGAGRNLQEAMKPVYFIANGRKIAIVSATQIERSTNYTKEATDDTAGVLKTLNPDKFLSVIEKTRLCSDYVIVFVHWGTENTNYYGNDQIELGQKFIDAGADVIIGGHTHCLQGFDFYNGKPIIYSLGNYWFNNRSIDTGLSQVIIHTDSNEIDFRFLPCKQRGCVTSLAEEGEKQRILDFMQNISASGISVGEDGIVVTVQP